jgi:hypothetical protein
VARVVLQGLMIALGVAAIAIGLMIFIPGPTFTAGLTEKFFVAFTGDHASATPPFSPTVDSELRFYAPFWITYGAVLIWVARRLRQRIAWVPGLAVLFFAGGVGRAIAYMVAGAPHPAFVGLMCVELGLPIVFVVLWVLARR